MKVYLEASDDDTKNMIGNLMNGIKEFILTEALSMKEYIEQSVEKMQKNL
ncbi:hypothetical protein KPL40_11640 [Clostridium gasigenes]|nr:hypothetical protein [Clostridium gasigenes]MBU3133105.1 hypothetical protein [Clostridium gasigenes]